MSRYLLDVNVIIALIDEDHVQFQRAQRWFHDDADLDWLICPIVEMGVVRIVSNPRYSSPSTPREAMESVRSVTRLGRCAFVPDDVDILDPETFDHLAILSGSQITDTYLLALAARHGAALATFDTRMATNAVRSTEVDVFLIP